MPLEPVYDNPDGSLVSRGATRGALARLNHALAPPPVSCLPRQLTRTAKRPSMPRIASQTHEHKNNTTAITHAPRSPCPSSTTARRTPHLTAPQHTQLQHTHTHTHTQPQSLRSPCPSSITKRRPQTGSARSTRRSRASTGARRSKACWRWTERCAGVCGRRQAAAGAYFHWPGTELNAQPACSKHAYTAGRPHTATCFSTGNCLLPARDDCAA